MNELKIFVNSEFGEIEVLLIEGKEYFPATMCAKALGYSNPRDAIRRHCKLEGVVKYDGVSKTENQHGIISQQVVEKNYINEGNLYRLITHSKLPSAERFESWVFDEVLPQIRKNGSYGLEMPELVKQFTSLVKQVSDLAETVLYILQETQKTPSTLGQVTEPIKMLQENPCPSRCKLDTFPEEIKNQVDQMLKDMMKQQALNYSMIARFCTINGHAISSPSVKTYFDKYYDVHE